MNILYHYDNRQVGFGSSVTVAFSTIKYCINNNLLCHINISNQMYGDIEQNLWDLFLKQPFKIEIDKNLYDTSLTTDPFKLGCWEYPNMYVALQKLRNNEHIAEYQKIYNKFFVLKEELQTPINNFCKNFQNSKLLGIHRRGRDQLTIGHGKNQKDKLDISYLFSVVDSEIDQYDYLYLTSDEDIVYKAFINRYGKKMIFFDTKDSVINYDRGLHELFLQENSIVKNNLLKTMILETLMLSKCNRLLLVNSNLSQIALYLCNHLNYKFYDQHVVYV